MAVARVSDVLWWRRRNVVFFAFVLKSDIYWLLTAAILLLDLPRNVTFLELLDELLVLGALVGAVRAVVHDETVAV